MTVGTPLCNTLSVMCGEIEVNQDGCKCRRCLRERGAGFMVDGVFMPQASVQMIVCAICGNKRCPHANDHRNACTDSNEPGQPGSAYA